MANGLENLGLLLFNLAMVRVYGFQTHGRFVFYLSVIALFRLVLDAGIGAKMTKQFGNRKRPLPAVLRSGLGWMGLLNLPFVVLIAVKPGWIVGNDPGAFGYFALWLFAMLVENIAISTFNGLQAMHLSFLSCLLYEGTKLTLVTYLWFARPAFEHFIKVANTGIFLASLSVILLMAFALGRFPADPKKDIPAHRPFILSALLLWVPTASTAIFPQIMSILIKCGLSDRHVSYYNAMASWSMIGAVILAPTANALFAWTARHDSGSASGNSSGHIALLGEYYRWTGIIAMGSSLALLAASGPILNLYGKEILPFINVYAILVMAQLADYPRFFTVPFLSGGRSAKASMFIELIRFFLTVGACACAILTGYGLMGVAMAIFIVQSLSGVLRLLHVRRSFPLPLFPLFIRNLVAATLSLIVFYHDFPDAVEYAIQTVIFLVFSGIRPADFKTVYKLATA